MVFYNIKQGLGDPKRGTPTLPSLQLQRIITGEENVWQMRKEITLCQLYVGISNLPTTSGFSLKPVNYLVSKKEGNTENFFSTTLRSNVLINSVFKWNNGKAHCGTKTAYDN